MMIKQNMHMKHINMKYEIYKTYPLISDFYNSYNVVSQIFELTLTEYIKKITKCLLQAFLSLKVCLHVMKNSGGRSKVVSSAVI